jgi:hypothetical protein
MAHECCCQVDAANGDALLFISQLMRSHGDLSCACIVMFCLLFHSGVSTPHCQQAE